MKGLITYQADVFNQVLSDWASNTANTNRPPVCKNSALINAGGWAASVPDASLIVSNWLSVCGTALSSRVIPIFKSVLAAQLEGLLFLSAGWGNTPLQSNLKVHMENITATVAAMNGWWATFNPDAAVAAAIQAHGQRLAEQSQTWAVEVPDGEYTFDSSWMPWVTHADGGSNCTELCLCYTAALVQQPWNFGSCTAALNINKGGYMRELPDGSFRRYQLYFINIGTVNIARPSQSKPAAPPDVLAQFLAGLPADPP